MKRVELKAILEKKGGNYQRYYFQNPTLHRDLTLWEDYEGLVEESRKQKIHAPKDRARIEICACYGMSDKTFYLMRKRLQELCEDV